ncbi:MAG TPA: hypothetical protein VK956_20865 [Verrucomicrobium sp.]|nr:hypothetical protein [Verrucomicrobium sp.]
MKFVPTLYVRGRAGYLLFHRGKWREDSVACASIKVVPGFILALEDVGYAESGLKPCHYFARATETPDHLIKHALN